MKKSRHKDCSGGCKDDEKKARYLMRVNPLRSLISSKPLSALAVRQQQQSLWGDQTMTFCSAAQRLEKSKKRAEEEAQVQSDGIVLFKNRTDILRIYESDALEEFRQSQGLDKVREELFGFLESEMSFEEGVMMFCFSLKSRGRDVTDWEGLNRMFPDLIVP